MFFSFATMSDREETSRHGVISSCQPVPVNAQASMNCQVRLTDVIL